MSDDEFDVAEVEAYLKNGKGKARPKKTKAEQAAANVQQKAARKKIIRAEEMGKARAPRPLAMLKELDWHIALKPAETDDDGKLVVDEGETTTVRSRVEARLLLSEYSESRGASFVTSGGGTHPCSQNKPQTDLFCICGVCTSASCPFTFKFMKEDKRWVLTEFSGHIDACFDTEDDHAAHEGAGRKRRTRRTCYDASELAHAVVATQRTAKLDFDPKDVKRILGAYTKTPPTNDLAQRVCDTALEILRGSAADNFKLLRPYIDELCNLGYGADIIQVESDKMNEIVLKNAKGEHKIEMKRIPKEQRAELDTSGLPSAEEDGIYYGGWIVSGFPTSKRMLEAGLIVKVCVSDFAHAKLRAKGSFAFAVGYDANNHIIPFAGMHNTSCTESQEGWTDLLEPMLAYYGELLDNVGVVHIADADKGGAAAYEALLVHATPFVCREHRGETFAGKFGKGSKKIYENFANALTEGQLRAAKRAMSAAQREFVEKLPESAQCKLSHPGKLHGAVTSNQVMREHKGASATIKCEPV